MDGNLLSISAAELYAHLGAFAAASGAKLIWMDFGRLLGAGISDLGREGRLI